jgi:hypothetical protein
VKVIDFLKRTHNHIASKKSLVEPVYYDKLSLVLRGAGTLRGVLGNKCAGHHNLKTVEIREIMFK